MSDKTLSTSSKPDKIWTASRPIKPLFDKPDKVWTASRPTKPLFQIADHTRITPQSNPQDEVYNITRYSFDIPDGEPHDDTNNLKIFVGSSETPIEKLLEDKK